MQEHIPHIDQFQSPIRDNKQHFSSEECMCACLFDGYDVKYEFRQQFQDLVNQILQSSVDYFFSQIWHFPIKYLFFPLNQEEKWL